MISETDTEMDTVHVLRKWDFTEMVIKYSSFYLLDDCALGIPIEKPV